MKHPLIDEAQNGLRKRVLSLFKGAYSFPRESNIVFVCGGNKTSDMRPRFRKYAEENAAEFDIFHPEFAMENLLSSSLSEPFDIADFESSIGNLSKAIVIFPEAAGSFAETGYFSAIPGLAKKTILVLDANYQGYDSFISQGPAKKIEELSIFRPVLQMSYKRPDFELVLRRVKKFPLSSTRKQLAWQKLSDLEDFEIFCLVHEIVSFMSIATLDDIEFILRGLSESHLSVHRFHQITSILVGSKYLETFGDYGHLRPSTTKGSLLKVVEGRRTEYNDLRLELASVYQDVGGDFLNLIGGL
ncbi:retron St85 family effector protein [Rhizobium wuzhouense]|nr:retron St85 family effector protein [Rhizobium wuzhouense]